MHGDATTLFVQYDLVDLFYSIGFPYKKIENKNYFVS